MKISFRSFQHRILRALDAAAPSALNEKMIGLVLQVGAQPPASNQVAGALAYLEKAHLARRDLSVADDPAWTLTEKGSWTLKNSPPATTRRRRGSLAAAPPPTFPERAGR